MKVKICWIEILKYELLILSFSYKTNLNIYSYETIIASNDVTFKWPV